MKNNSLNEAKEQFVIANKVLMEDYGIMPNSYSEDSYDDSYPYDADEESLNASLKGDEKISQIREIALQGLQEYANDVDTETYQFYKKIWLMCDKVVSEKDNTASTKE